MYRVLILSTCVLLLCACSMSTRQIGFGFDDPPDYPAEKQATKSESAFSPASLSLGGEPTRNRSANTPQLAALQSKGDKAPAETYERPPKGALSDRDYSDTELEVEQARNLINAYRNEHGLKPLALNARLTEAARNHSRDLAKWDRISHYGSDGSNPWDRVKRTGYLARVAAENVGTGQSTFKEVLQGWKDSPGHNKNLLLKDAAHMGIALVKDPKTEFKTFWTLVLGSTS